MKYVILCHYDITKLNYYAGERIRERIGPKLSNALIFDTAEEAQEVADELSDTWFAGAHGISNKELFEAKLKGT